MKVFKRVEKNDLIIGEPYYLSSNGTEKMIFVYWDEYQDPFFYPLEFHSYIEEDDGTVGFGNPYIYQEDDEEV